MSNKAISFSASIVTVLVISVVAYLTLIGPISMGVDRQTCTAKVTRFFGLVTIAETPVGFVHSCPDFFWNIQYNRGRPRMLLLKGGLTGWEFVWLDASGVKEIGQFKEEPDDFYITIFPLTDGAVLLSQYGHKAAVVTENGQIMRFRLKSFNYSRTDWTVSGWLSEKIYPSPADLIDLRYSRDYGNDITYNWVSSEDLIRWFNTNSVSEAK